MNLNEFRHSPTGVLVPISGSSPDGTWRHMAFLPHPLGSKEPTLSAATYRKVANARAALAALDSTARRLPNPRLFRQSTLRLEAQSTAALEGTYEPLERVLASDLAGIQDPSMREVLNYVLVAEQAFAWSKEGRSWTVSAVSELQRLLMLGTSGEREYSGVRPIQVVIGRREGAHPDDPPIQAARFVPPPPGPDLHARLRDLLEWMETDHRPRIDPVVATAMGHYEFEALHPFHDGNGRLGRLLVVLQLHRCGILSEPTITVSPWFEARRTQYYDVLLGVSTTGDWSTWTSFFADGIAQSAEETRLRMLALADVQTELKAHLQQSAVRTANARVLVDFAVGTPTFTIAQAADAVGMRYQGAKRLVGALVDLGILAPFMERAYNRRYHAPRVMDVLLGHAGRAQLQPDRT